jgi:hypothetical protein
MNATERLFELPPVEQDDASPDVLRLAFSGAVELDRTDEEDVRLYNSLAAGGIFNLELRVDVAGVVIRHKRDGRGLPSTVTHSKAIAVVDVVRR